MLFMLHHMDIMIVTLFSGSSQWVILDMGILNQMIAQIGITCPNCNETNSLIFKRHSKRYGFCYNITLSCSVCLVQTSQNFSSRRSAVKQAAQPFVVNDIVVLLFNQLGLGHTAMKKICMSFWVGGPTFEDIPDQGIQDHLYYH